MRLLALLVFGGCIEASLVPCGDLSCPTGTVCMDSMCVAPEQLAACADVPDGMRCTVARGGGVCGNGICLLARCGDNVVGPTEVCDDGNTLSGDGCSSDCLSMETCGNGIPELGERCDCGDAEHPGPAACEGTSNGGERCRVDCTFPRCGNGHLDPLEVCDDGNELDEDGCSRYCDSLETCGNGVRDVGEQCDDGNVLDADACQSTCMLPRCGDSITDAALNETCDDGNTNDADGCQGTCRLPGCGDGVLDASEVCDLGALNSDAANAPCRLDCTVRRCGDQIIDPTYGESCDQGGSTQYCDGDCSLPMCGDAYTNVVLEQCEDQNQTNGDGCDNNCTYTACGNGVQTENEFCDPGPTETASCDGNCTFVECGDGYLNAAAGETCEDNNTNNGDGCDSNCRPTGCGNGVQSEGEQCDTGGDSDSCDGDCTLRECGDNYRNSREGCDDGNPSDGDGCDSNCTPTGCGNGVTSVGESCDDGNLVNEDGCDSNCSPTGCRNGVVTAGEECDVGGESASCDADCTFRVCGDGYVNPLAEQCDDGNDVDDDACPNSCLPL